MTSILPFPPETRPCLKPSLCWNLILWNCPYSFHFSTHLQFQQAFIKCYYALWGVEVTKVYNTQSLCSRESSHGIDRQIKNYNPRCCCWGALTLAIVAIINICLVLSMTRHYSKCLTGRNSVLLRNVNLADRIHSQTDILAPEAMLVTPTPPHQWWRETHVAVGAIRGHRMEATLEKRTADVSFGR